MSLSRRNLLRRIGAVAAGTAVAPSSAEATLSPMFSESRPRSGGNRPRGPIRLNRNENAYGPSPNVISTMQEAVTSANRYPDVDSEALRNTIAGLHGVTTEQVVLGCGSGEILRMAVGAFVGPRKKLIVALPTCELIADCARRAGAEVIAVPLTRAYSHDLEAMLAHSDAATGLVYICNPNNPTGSLTRRQDLEAFLRLLPPATCVLIDEAYHHYAGPSSDYASFIDRPLDDGRLIVARSFSKIYGLAGMRVGYAIAAVSTAVRLASYRLAEDVNVVAARAAVRALEDAEHVRRSVMWNDDDRQEFFNQANARMLRTIDSRTNFAMVNTERPAVEIVEHFKKNNVLISPPFPTFDTYIRVSLGTPSEMREFWRVWDLMPNHKMTM
jgi:histidinol-phosphate aminotransferase